MLDEFDTTKLLNLISIVYDRGFLLFKTDYSFIHSFIRSTLNKTVAVNLTMANLEYLSTVKLSG